MSLLDPQTMADAIRRLDEAVAARQHRSATLESRMDGVIRRFEEDIRRGVDDPARLRRDVAEEERRIRTEREQHEEVFGREWIEALESLDRLCRQIRAEQPLLTHLGIHHLNAARPAPEALAFGRIRLSYGSWQGPVPRLVSFPFPRAQWLDAEQPDAVGHVHRLVLRVLTVLPANGLRIVACDPLRLGRSLEPFLPLLGENRPFVDRRILTRAEEIGDALSRELALVEEVLQSRLGHAHPDWRAYNARHGDAPLPFTLLLLFDAPEQLTNDSLWAVERLIEHGPRCGLLPVLVGREEQLADARTKRLRDAVRTHADPLAGQLRWHSEAVSVRHLQCVEEDEPWPDDGRIGTLIGDLARHFRQAGRVTKGFSTLFGMEPRWSASSQHGLAVPVGWQSDGRSLLFVLGDASNAYHALIAGRTGSGKSNLLHVLIHSLCHHYAPEELRLYLLDYKQGTEFSAYADPPPPHAALVAVESSPEYGLTVLRHLQAILKQRSDLFKRAGVADIAQYREKTAEGMPRIVLLVDEFQGMFTEDQAHRAAVEQAFSVLLRQARAFGIHLVLATQTLKGADVLQKSEFTSQIGMRLCLACSEEDSRVTLGSANLAGASLTGPPQAILNASQGVPSANRLFDVPFAAPDERRVRLLDIATAAAGRPAGEPTRLFRGMVPPAFPDTDAFTTHAGGPNVAPSLLLGEELAFDPQPFRCGLERRKGANLLLAGFDEAIQADLLRAVLRSLAGSGRIEGVHYVNAADRDRADLLAELPPDVPVTMVGGEWDGDLSGFAGAPAAGRCKVLVIDGLDFVARPLLDFSPYSPAGKTPSPAQALRALLQDGPCTGSFVVASTGRLGGFSKDLTGCFNLRIGFTLNEDEAAGLTGGGTMGSAKLRGLDTGDKALFFHAPTGQRAWFRPFRRPSPRQG